jgi:hypothetical protein
MGLGGSGIMNDIGQLAWNQIYAIMQARRK